MIFPGILQVFLGQLERMSGLYLGIRLGYSGSNISMRFRWPCKGITLSLVVSCKAGHFNLCLGCRQLISKLHFFRLSLLFPKLCQSVPDIENSQSLTLRLYAVSYILCNMMPFKRSKNRERLKTLHCFPSSARYWKLYTLTLHAVSYILCNIMPFERSKSRERLKTCTWRTAASSCA